nr:immunoglobulin heavy chain junction region [Mus musculus]
CARRGNRYFDVW